MTDAVCGIDECEKCINDADPDARIGAPNMPPAEWYETTMSRNSPIVDAEGQHYATYNICGPETGRGFGYLFGWHSHFNGNIEGDRSIAPEKMPKTITLDRFNKPRLSAFRDGKIVKVGGCNIGYKHSPNGLTIDEAEAWHDDPDRVLVRGQAFADDYGVGVNLVLDPSVTFGQAQKIMSAPFSPEIATVAEFGKRVRSHLFAASLVGREGLEA